MKAIKTYQGTIYPWNCDHMGHMNVQFYVAKFDEAIWSLFSCLGLTSTYLRENKRGMVALEQQLKYYKEVLAGDTIYIESEIMEIRSKTILIKHMMYNLESKDMVSETEITGLHIDTDIRKGMAFPEFVKDKFHEMTKVKTSGTQANENVGLIK
jgi:acyl-CoA thioester hydrolase